MTVWRVHFAVVVASLAWAPAAAGAPPAVSIQASASSGAAPLSVTLAAAGDPATYRWDLGDGSGAEGQTVAHVYERAGRYTATVTATSAAGEVGQARTSIAAISVTLRAARIARHGTRVTFRGSVVPTPTGRAKITLRGISRLVATARTRKGGVFRIVKRAAAPDTFRAFFSEIGSNSVAVAVRPLLRVSLAGAQTVGRPLTVVVRVLPRRGGPVRARIFRRGIETARKTLPGAARVRIDTRRAGRYEVRLATVPSPGFVASFRRIRFGVRLPSLALGTRGASVRILEEELAERRYALKGIDGAYGFDTYEAVLAAQKLHGLPRTGRVDTRLWGVLRRSRAPAPRIFGSGTHIEVDKGRQLLFEVRRGRVERVVHVSTGATGNTPLGRWGVYRKVPGWDWVLWYPMYFLRGFAIHGYPSVPPYPASHGCVRVPMWLAPGLYSRYGFGATIYVY